MAEVNQPRRRRNRQRQRLAPVQRQNEGKFVMAPFDPPPAFKSGWKDIRLELALGSTDVTLTTWAIAEGLSVLGIAANAFKLRKLAVWVMPGTAANQSKPEVVMSVRDPFGGGTLGTRTDAGLLSRCARVAYSYSDAARELSLDLPDATPGVELCLIAASQAIGVIQVSLSYNV
jgi:hypothetical protein